MNVFISFCVLLACFLSVDALTLTECQDGQLDIMNGTKTSITCTNIVREHNIYWSINRLSTGETEMTIGTCMSCLNRTCPACNVSNTEGTDYTITRMKNGSADYSTVGFVANEEEHHNSIVKCSRLNNQSNVNCSINVIEVYKLSGCFVTENAQTPISCSYREPSHGMYWSITYPNGTVTRVAECAPCGNVTCPDCDVKNTDFRVTRDQHSSVIKMVNGSDVDKNGAKLQCSRFDNVTADDCMIRVFYYKLPQCEDGQLDVSEVEPWTTVNCEGLRQLQNMNWTITDHSGHVSQIAFCDSMKNCNTISSNVTVSRNNTVSNLTFVGHVREKANLALTCVMRDGDSRDSCQIRTFYPAETNNITVGVDGNLTVTGRVYIDKVYASDNNITCQWFHTVDNVTGDQLLSSLSLSTFTDTDGPEYQLGYCDTTLSVNSSEITHYFSVLIRPSNKSLQVDGVVTIKEPGETLNTTCPDFVSEGSNLTCECSHLTAQHGNPPATISWINETGTAVLHVPNVSRHLNGTDYVCTSVWGAGMPEVQSSMNYTLRVAYGPENVTLIGSAYYITHNLQNVTLTCTWEDVCPSVNVTWSVPCMNLAFSLDNSTCTICSTLIKNVSEVTCTAVNTGILQLNATDVFTFLFNKPGQNLTTTCLDYVSEGSDLTCECSHLAAQHGNPPATISWIYDTETAVLHVPNVSRQLNGTDYVCTSVWGAGMPEVQTSMNYTLRVAYGPGNVTLTGSAYYITNDLQNVTLTCTWEDVHPSVNVTWSVPCEDLAFSLYNSTCTIDTAVITNVTAVTCTAVNTGIPQLNATDVFTFLVEEPGQNLITTCPDYVSEGSDLTCVCSHLTAHHGNPPATISWRDVTDTAVLHIRNVSRDMNGSEYVCSSVWGEGRPEEVRNSNNYTMLVAYGPNNVTLYPTGDGNDDPNNVTLTCTYDEAYPSANFSWSVACVAFTLTSESSTCTIDKDMIDVREVACTAFNAKLAEINATRVHAFLYNDAVTGPPFPLVGVVVGVVAAVLLFIIIVVVIIIAKRRASRKTHKDSSTRANDEDQLPYDSLQMSEVGLRSEYSDVGSHGNALHADTGATPYESLRRSDVGLTSEYSEIGATGTSR